LTEQIIQYAVDLLPTHDPGRTTFSTTNGPVDVFVDVFSPLPRLIIVGAGHIAIPLVTLAKTLGFRTIVMDARSAFATRERFPHADEVMVEWPSSAMGRLGLDAATYIAVVTHDDKQDIPALQAALASPGALHRHPRFPGNTGQTRPVAQAHSVSLTSNCGAFTRRLDWT